MYENAEFRYDARDRRHPIGERDDSGKMGDRVNQGATVPCCSVSRAQLDPALGQPSNRALNQTTPWRASTPRVW